MDNKNNSSYFKDELKIKEINNESSLINEDNIKSIDLSLDKLNNMRQVNNSNLKKQFYIDNI